MKLYTFPKAAFPLWPTQSQPQHWGTSFSTALLLFQPQTVPQTDSHLWILWRHYTPAIFVPSLPIVGRHLPFYLLLLRHQLPVCVSFPLWSLLCSKGFSEHLVWIAFIASPHCITVIFLWFSPPLYCIPLLGTQSFSFLYHQDYNKDTVNGWWMKIGTACAYIPHILLIGEL